MQVGGRSARLRKWPAMAAGRHQRCPDTESHSSQRPPSALLARAIQELHRSNQYTSAGDGEGSRVIRRRSRPQEGVEPTNNHAEQELRGFVLWRKTTLGTHSERGDRFATNLKSVIHTCRKQKRHVLSYLTEAIQAALNNRSVPSLLHAP